MDKVIKWHLHRIFKTSSQNQPTFHTKVRLFLDRSCAILSSFKIVVIFNITSTEIKTKSADVLLKMATILKELRIPQLRSMKNGLYNESIDLNTYMFFISFLIINDVVTRILGTKYF